MSFVLSLKDTYFFYSCKKKKFNSKSITKKCILMIRLNGNYTCGQMAYLVPNHTLYITNWLLNRSNYLQYKNTTSSLDFQNRCFYGLKNYIWKGRQAFVAILRIIMLPCLSQLKPLKDL